jgi:hypothetical protein
VAKLRVRTKNGAQGAIRIIEVSLFFTFGLRRRRIKPTQRRAEASNAKLAGSGTGSALAVEITPIGSEAKFTG